jgi:L-fuconolactonase
MSIDTHVHLVDDPARGYRWIDAPGHERIRQRFDLDDLGDELERAAVDSALWIEPGLRELEPTLSALDLARERPELAGVVGWIDAQTDPRRVIAAYRDHAGGDRLVGVRDHVQRYDESYLDSPAARRSLNALGEEGLPYEFIVRRAQLASAARAARAAPFTRFALTHMGYGPFDGSEWDLWREGIMALGELPNVVVKVSAIPTASSPHLRAIREVVLEAFGPHRMMLGSNWPLCLLDGTYGESWDRVTGVLDGLTMSERRRVATGTATEFYRLSPGGAANEAKRSGRA